MRRTIAIVSCLAALCLTVLVIWSYMQRIGPGDTPAPEANTNNGQASNKSSDPTGEKAVDPRLFQSPTCVVYFADGQFSPCHYDSESKILYRWKGVVLRREQLPAAYSGTISGLRMHYAKDFNVILSIEAPVKYREVNGRYRPGYLDRSSRAFYEWKGIVLNKQEVPDKSRDGQDAIVKPDAFGEVIEVPLPTHLKEQPKLWKKS